jgi:hypothetical protein
MVESGVSLGGNSLFGLFHFPSAPSVAKPVPIPAWSADGGGVYCVWTVLVPAGLMFTNGINAWYCARGAC